MIPKIIHQIWIGPLDPPRNMMKTWKRKYKDYEYMFWNESLIRERNLQLVTANRINKIEEICGKADILRLEILYKYGGIYTDADSICMEKIPDESWKYKTPENMVDVKVNTKVNAAIINLFIFILYLLTIYKKTN